MLAPILYLLAAISAILGFLSLIGVVALDLGWVGLFVAAAIFALVAFFIGGWQVGRRI